MTTNFKDTGFMPTRNGCAWSIANYSGVLTCPRESHVFREESFVGRRGGCAWSICGEGVGATMHPPAYYYFLNGGSNTSHVFVVYRWWCPAARAKLEKKLSNDMKSTMYRKRRILAEQKQRIRCHLNHINQVRNSLRRKKREFELILKTKQRNAIKLRGQFLQKRRRLLRFHLQHVQKVQRQRRCKRQNVCITSLLRKASQQISNQTKPSDPLKVYGRPPRYPSPVTKTAQQTQQIRNMRRNRRLLHRREA